MQKLAITSQYVAAEIDSIGAGLTSLRTTKSESELLGQWMGSTGGMTSGFVMAPVIGLVSSNGKVMHEGEIFEPGKHGYARKTAFTAQQKSANTLLLTYIHDPKKSPGIYPFPHRIDVEYAVHARELTTKVSIHNTGDQTMYFGAGLHPAFTWPLPDGGAKESHSLTLSSPLPKGTQIYRPVDGNIRADATDANPFNAQGIWQPKAADFQKDAFFFVNPNNKHSNELTFKDANGTPKLRFLMEGWDGLGIWSKPDQSGSFICVEPIAGVALVEKTATPPELKDIKGLRRLAPNESFSARMHVLVL